MIRLNFYLQSVLCGVAICLAIAALFWYEALYYLLYWLIPIGFTQYVGGIILLIREKTRTPIVIGYFITATVTLLVLYSGYFEIIIFILSPMLAILYWYISFQLFKKERT